MQNILACLKTESFPRSPDAGKKQKSFGELKGEEAKSKKIQFQN
jgi:hypothetical protein